MHSIFYFASLWSFSEPVKQVSSSPIWVPLALGFLVLLIFLWGLTRGNVKDENIPDLETNGGANDLQDNSVQH